MPQGVTAPNGLGSDPSSCSPPADLRNVRTHCLGAAWKWIKNLSLKAQNRWLLTSHPRSLLHGTSASGYDMTPVLQASGFRVTVFASGCQCDQSLGG